MGGRSSGLMMDDKIQFISLKRIFLDIGVIWIYKPINVIWLWTKIYEENVNKLLRYILGANLKCQFFVIFGTLEVNFFV